MSSYLWPVTPTDKQMTEAALLQTADRTFSKTSDKPVVPLLTAFTI